MSEEQTAAIPAEHVSLNESGVITLSEEALAAMEGVEAPVLEEATPAPLIPEATTSRKIKHNGQEVEVLPEQEIELLQKGYNYEQKMAALEADRARLQSYNGLVSAIEASPEIRQKVSAALGYQQEPAKPEIPQFNDPIEQLKWETRQETLREVEEKFIKPMQAQTLQATHAQTLNSVRQQVQSDPQYKEVQAAILAQIKSLPESISKPMYAQLDQDPRAYMDMFTTTKARLTSTSNPSPATGDPPSPTKRETKAPLLEGSLNAPETASETRMTERIKELERKSRNGDFRATGELMSMLA